MDMLRNSLPLSFDTYNIDITSLTAITAWLPDTYQCLSDQNVMRSINKWFTNGKFVSYVNGITAIVIEYTIQQ